MPAAGVVPDHPPARARGRALAAQIHDPGGRIAQELDGAAIKRDLLLQRRLVAGEALLDGCRLARHLAEPRLVAHGHPGGGESRGHRGDDRRGRRPREPGAAAGAARVFHAAHERLAHGGKRSLRARRQHRARERVLRLPDGGLALRAARQVSLELHEVIAVQRTGRVDRGQGLEGFVAHVGVTASRSRASARRMRVLTVPSGCASRSAISRCVRPE